MKINCIIVDDEPLARKVLKQYIGSVSSLELVKECFNAIDAAAFLHENEIDLMFLDIKMPKITGLQFLKTLKSPPLIIITTAFSEFALEGYEFGVVDYLLKPIPFERFLKAINQVRERMSLKNTQPVEKKKLPETDFIILKSDTTEYKVNYSEIMYLEAYGNFVKVHTVNKMLLISENLKSISNKLSKDIFIRIHKSFIVNINRIEKIKGNKVFIGNESIPVGRYYKRDFDEFIMLKKK